GQLHWHEGSTLDTELVRALMKEVEVVYHLAAAVGVKNIINNLVASIENNVRGTEVVLKQAAEYTCRVLLTSTSEVYGRSTKRRPFAEDDDLRMGQTLKTRWSYACAKALDEYLGFAYWHERGLPVTVARLFNTVGERQTDAYGMVLPTFVRQALAGEPLTVYGNGQQSRTFCHVDDVVRALLGVMALEETVGQVYNIGSAKEITIEALADRVISQLDSSSQKLPVPYDQAYAVGFDDIARRVPDISKIKATLNWEPSIGLDDIIKRVAAQLAPSLQPQAV
ncbi:GDP-mannose 4,6-dehydratase, partial [Patescibacteria group bacterium]|nr:GDP-mannose 4,6-dehydratase [Patescibacteria group bacterium]